MPTYNQFPPRHKREFAKRLLGWWSYNRRDFPWRKTKNPYHVLVAEGLLRKTTARQVKKIYLKFLEEYPSPEALAQASKKNLKNLLRPLGMEHKRAALLRKLGKKIVEKHGGSVPSQAGNLLELPGVGRYAANAVLCFAHREDVPMVDTNVARVATRFFGFKSERARLKDDPLLWAFVGSLIPMGRATDFNLALLDFAAQVCTARNPKCNECIVCDLCQAKEKLKTATCMGWGKA